MNSMARVQGDIPLQKTCVVLVCLCSLIFPALLAAQLTPQQAAGKQIYLTGKSSPERPIEALLGEGSTRIPGSLVPCGTCHGPEGAGRPEAGVSPSNLNWQVLLQPHETDSALERSHSVYDENSLRRAITKGVDPAGNPLGVAMPRFQMTAGDLDDLIEYLKILGREPELGLTDDGIRIGVIIPGGALAASGRDFASVFQHYFEDINRLGGLYNRKIELVTLQVSGTESDIEQQVRDFAEKKKVFALLDTLAPGTDQKLVELVEQLRIPMIGTFAFRADPPASTGSQTFYVLSGLLQQASVLVKFAHQHQEDVASPSAVVYPQIMQELATATLDRCNSIGMRSVVPLAYTEFTAEKIAAALAKQNAGTVFFLGSGKELQKLLEAAKSVQWNPTVFQPGPLAGREVFDIPGLFAERVFFAFPALPSDYDPAAIHEFRLLLQKNKLKPVQPALSLTVVALAKILVGGLRQAGRELNRRKLVESLEQLYDFNTGMTPAISYGPRRRIGALGAHVVRLDLKQKTFTPVDAWMAP